MFGHKDTSGSDNDRLNAGIRSAVHLLVIHS
jgi:hypothetical protein